MGSRSVRAPLALGLSGALGSGFGSPWLGRGGCTIAFPLRHQPNNAQAIIATNTATEAAA